MFPQKLWHRVQQAKTRTAHKKCDDGEQPSNSVRLLSIKKRDFAALFCAICNQTDSTRKSPRSWFLYLSRLKELVPLPAEYTSVKDLYPALFKNGFWAPASPDYMLEFSTFDTAVTEKFQWLIIYAEKLSSEFFNQNVYPPKWAAHHVSQKRGIQTPPSINIILPLLRDKVSTFNMQAHLTNMK